MDIETIQHGMTALSLVDPDVKNALDEVGLPAPRYMPETGFEAFLSIIISQQVSTTVAKVIMGRVVSLMDEVTPEAFSEISEQSLRRAGMSYRKIDYAKGLSEAVLKGSFDIDGLKTLSDKDAIKTITGLKGLGVWSAEIYLMFSVGRTDIFPANDLGILVALERLKGLSEKPTPAQAREIVNRWTPWRSVGALFLWHYYHQRFSEGE
ncbi:DNA-3-methyladenine glycosylase family protein [Vibrio salinus]|uniref:DNA-3-methyladenine glycosylase family protein n=1 Tax=Vibrio salinus TaxID=2899784 RepID=UPI001E3799AB|nr:DNA-3-methyladenine glycosylase 2 family protein [Vibrio salinus]MCE0494876.1 DNA-3-methyladenine glycosylase 2 family protein [Vibrio salinus]